MNTETITAIVTTLLGLIIRAIEKRQLKKSGKLNDVPTPPPGDNDSDKK